jgi:hypothetical protein
MTLIKDLIEIPEQVQRGDIVLNLASGVEQAEQTLRDYVVTPQLARCFDDAQALAHQFPDHPELELEVRLGDLGKAFEVLRRAVHAEHGRVDVDQSQRQALRHFAQPLNLGTLHERHFIYADDWFRHLQRALAKGGGEVTVRRLREITDLPRPKGLPDHLQNLLIRVFAEHGQYAFTLHGGLAEPTLKEMSDDLVLVRQALAEPQDWYKALRHAAALFGEGLPHPLRTANNQKLLQDRVTEAVAASVETCRDLRRALQERLQHLKLAPACDRMANAALAVRVLDDLQGREGADRVQALAGVTAHTSMAALGRSIASPDDLPGGGPQAGGAGGDRHSYPTREAPGHPAAGTRAVRKTARGQGGGEAGRQAGGIRRGGEGAVGGDPDRPGERGRQDPEPEL